MNSASSATELARQLVTELAAGGVRHVVLCPGSRSAPLAYAVHDLARTGSIELHVRHDERVAGFTALGIGRATGVPAAVVTTSGTAVANLHPAVLEAHHGGVPLLILSADRPARLRGTWANQTSDLQAGLFGAAPRFAADLAPGAAVEEWTASARAAVAAAVGDAGRPGPAHLNLGFDDPLVPADDERTWRPDLVERAGPVAPAEAPAEPPTEPPTEPPREAGPARPLGSRAVVLAGDRSWPGAREVAERLGLPLLAEPTSGARSGRNAIGPYRLLLDHPELGGQIEQVVVFGRPTLSRPVTRLLARPDVEVILVPTREGDPGPDRPDVRRLSLRDAAGWLTEPARPTPERAAWLARWSGAGAAAARAVESVLDGWPILTGPLVAREVAAATGPADALVLAASNPVRDADLAGAPWAWPAGPGTRLGSGLVHANRGLSGIDGTVSTAIGVGLASGRPTRALVGDVAFLHDVGGLVSGPAERRPDLTLVVLNDAGGGIFSLLEPGADAERDEASFARFERLFGTPHTVDLSSMCGGLGVPHAVVASAAGLRERLAERPDGVRVIEVRVDREDLVPLHEAIARTVRTAVDAAG